jgi:hypothetical protein
VDNHGCSGCALPVFIDVPKSESTVRLQCPQDSIFFAGRRARYTLLLASSSDLSDTTIAFTAGIRFDHIVLAPLFAFDTTAIDGREFVARIHGSRSDTIKTGALATLDFVVLLTDTACSNISLEYFAWNDDPVAVGIEEASCIACVKICREGGERLIEMEGQVSLMQNQPNPFNSTTRIEYEIIERGHTELSVYDANGRRVVMLVNGDIEPGRYAVSFDAGELPSGMYFCVLKTPRIMKSRAMIITK